MKKTWIWIPGLLLVLAAACKNGDKKNEDKSSAPLAAKADSLYNELLKEHDNGMRGWMKIEGKQKQIKTLLDSIGTLPANDRSALKDYEGKLTEASAALGDAYEKMDGWMREMNLDSALDNPAMRIQYLTGEKTRGSEITALINSSLQKADSVLNPAAK